MLRFCNDDYGPRFLKGAENGESHKKTCGIRDKMDDKPGSADVPGESDRAGTTAEPRVVEDKAKENRRVNKATPEGATASGVPGMLSV